MNLDLFEPLLRDLLAARPDVTGAWTLADTGYTLFGVQFKTAGGQAAWVRLTAGSGPNPVKRTPLPRPGDREMPERRGLPGDVGARLESMLRVLLEGGDVPGLAWVMTGHEWRSQQGRAKPVQGAAAGLIVRFSDGSEVYLRLYG